MPPAAKKGPAKKAAKPAKAAAKKAPAKPAKKAAKAAPSMSEVEHQHAVERAEHAHQDPRGTPGQIHKEQGKVQAENFGQARNRRIPRLQTVSNWFRRGKGR